MNCIIKWLVAISWVLPTSAIATDWVKLGSDREVEAYYDRESLRIVEYQFVRFNQYGILVGYGPVKKALVVTLLYNFFSPTRCVQEDMCLDQPVNSYAMDIGITCGDLDMWYVVGRRATSGKFGHGRTVLIEVNEEGNDYHGLEENQLYRQYTGPLQRKMLRQIGHLCEVPRRGSVGRDDPGSSGVDWSKVK
jgi:hypothetical protein